MVRNGRVLRDENYRDKVAKVNYANLDACKEIKFLIEVFGNGRSVFGFSYIPEAVYSDSLNLFTAPFHPMLDKFQSEKLYSRPGKCH